MLGGERRRVAASQRVNEVPHGMNETRLPSGLRIVEAEALRSAVGVERERRAVSRATVTAIDPEDPRVPVISGPSSWAQCSVMISRSGEYAISRTP